MDDLRFKSLMFHYENGFKSRLVIEIINADNPKEHFRRAIRDISLFKNFMIITWVQKQ